MLQERDLQLDTVAVKKTEKVPGKSLANTVELASVSGKWNKEETELTLDTMTLTATSGKLVNTQNNSRRNQGKKDHILNSIKWVFNAFRKQ